MSKGNKNPKEIFTVEPSMANKYNLPNDIQQDLADAFKFYDQEDEGLIKMNHFRNILHNFGFHKMAKREIDEQLKRADPQAHTKNWATFDAVKYVVGYQWVHKSGCDDEALDCWNLFDKRGKGTISGADLKQVLSSYLDFPVSEHDIQDFIQLCDGNADGSGLIH